MAANLPEVDVRTEGLTPAQPQEAPAEKPRDAGAERRTIYVSNEGTEEDDGATAENADHAGPCNRIGKRREKTGRNRGLRTGISRYLD